MISVSFSYVNSLISEIYPFSITEISEYEDLIDFEWLSRNKNINWNIEIVSEFYSKWNWESLEENRAIFNKFTLGLFFPEKATLQRCNCWKDLELCEDDQCIVILKKFYRVKSQYNFYPDDFIQIQMMCDSGFIDSGMINNFYRTKDSLNLLRFQPPYNS